MGSWWDDPGHDGDDLAPVDAAEDELVLVGAALRSALVMPVDPDTADAHVRLMVAAREAASGARGGTASRPGRSGGRRIRPGDRRMPGRLAAGLAAAAVVLAAAGIAGDLPGPVQQRFATAAASLGISIPDGGHDGAARVVTPVPAVAPPMPAPSPAPTAPSLPAPTGAAPSPLSLPYPRAPAPSPVVVPADTPGGPPAPSVPLPPSAAPSGGRLPAPTPPTTPSAPVTTEPSGGAAPPTTPAAGAGGCVDAVLLSVDATLGIGGREVLVVVRTTGTVPYLSAVVGGVAVSLTPASGGFRGTITSATAIAPGAVVRVGSCGGSLQRSTTVHV